MTYSLIFEKKQKHLKESYNEANKTIKSYIFPVLTLF